MYFIKDFLKILIKYIFIMIKSINYKIKWEMVVNN